MMKLSLSSTQDCNLIHVYSQYQYVPLEITFIYRLVADGTFPPLLVSLMGTIKKHQVSTVYSTQITLKGLPSPTYQGEIVQHTRPAVYMATARYLG